MNLLNSMNNNMNNNLNNNNMIYNNMINFMNQLNNQMNINNINNNMLYNDMINDINFNLNIINNNLNNIINSLNNINNILINQQDNNYTPINFIKSIINQNIQISNQISYNNNIINSTINNPLLFQKKNNIIEQNNQIHGILPREKEEEKLNIVDYFPGNKNERINIMFSNPDGSVINIIVPIDIKIKDLLSAYAKKMGFNQNLLGKKFSFLFNGQTININEEKDLISFGLVDKAKITVFLPRNLKKINDI